MTESLIAVEVNCATGETIERPLTAEEISMIEADAIAYAGDYIKYNPMYVPMRIYPCNCI